MSPKAFKQQIDQLISELNNCYELCLAVRNNRRLGPTTDALDRLESGLKSGAHGIEVEFNDLRNIIGSRMDLGDDASRISLARSISDLQGDVQIRLSDIAYKRKGSEHPHFKDISGKWSRIEQDVTDTLVSLGKRLEVSAAKAETPNPAGPVPRPVKHKTDELVIKMDQYDLLISHMKNSWVETVVAGRIVYANVYDTKLKQAEKPDGFIKALPKIPKPARTPTWEREEQRRRPVREDSWNNQQGW